MSAGLLDEADRSGDTEEAEICWRRDGEVRDASPYVVVRSYGL